MMVTPKQRASAFAEFTAPEAAMATVMDCNRYAGLPPAVAAQKAMDDYAALRVIEPSTKREKTAILRRILMELSGKGKDLSTVDAPTVMAYRAFLQQQVDQGMAAENYAYNIVKEWNAIVSLLFGEKSRPGEGLKMKGFRQTPKQVEHLEMEEIDKMIGQLPLMRFQHEHYRRAVEMFLELAIASAGRWDSIGSELTTVGMVDYVAGTIRFREVKNRPEHSAVLSERCLAALKRHEAFLRTTPQWKGVDTPLLVGPRGKMVTYNTMRCALHALAAASGIQKNVTTHLFRKSVGTHMGKENPRLAREQLGITAKVFDRHYNQPTVKDRIERRDLLMGSQQRTVGEETRIGALFLQLRRGVVTQQEFEREVNRSLLSGAPTPRSRDGDPAFG
jgi:integrase